ncbi:MAG: aminopeptidase P family protein [Bacteroidetes bacterium]|nr:aminopeptidase P family protein [Bacteroidota bacterium]
MKKTAIIPALLFLLFCFSSFSRISNYSYESDLLSADFHKGRRDALRKLMPENSAAVIFSNKELIRSNDVEFDFHQDPDMYYLSGYMEPNSALVIFKEPQRFDSIITNEILFVQERDPAQEVWTGRMLGVEAASKTLGIKNVLSDKEFSKFNFGWKRFVNVLSLPLRDLSVEKNEPLGSQSEMENSFQAQLSSNGNRGGEQLTGMLLQLRKVKQPAELQLLKRAIDITDSGHIELMKALQPDMTEYQVQAIVEYEFKKRGAEYEGYPSICGSGENSCILHYTSNRRAFTGNELIVVDAGAEYHGYSADVTRTLPVNGKFSPEQKLIYEIVLAAQEAGIKKCMAGNDFHDPHKAAVKVIQDGLMKLGIISSPEQFDLYFMHGTSHHIGLDVHDADYEGKLVANNIITVEPGIYIPEGSPCDKKWWNIGVRIEDDVLITNGVPDVLSEAVPKKVEEIEKMMALTSYLNDAK